jgi:hypothetical protein
MAMDELSLLPAVRNAATGHMIVADGFFRRHRARMAAAAPPFML